MSSFGIVAASLAAYLLGSYSNSVIMAAMKVLSRGKNLWMRTIASTIVGEGVDTVVFVLIATLAGVFPWECVREPDPDQLPLQGQRGSAFHTGHLSGREFS